MMASIITTVSLDEKTKAVAETLPNFSHFVRECLMRYAVQHSDFEKICARPDGKRFLSDRKLGPGSRCNPYHKGPHCFACWPYGKPDDRNIAKMQEKKTEIQFVKNEWWLEKGQYILKTDGVTLAYPDGAKREIEISNPYDLEWLDEKTREMNRDLVELWGAPITKTKKTPKSTKTLGFFASIRQKIRDRSR